MISNKGFSLLELILVIAIVAVVGLSSTAYTSRFYTQNSVSTTADQLVSSLRKAQLYSMLGKQNGGTWGVRFTTTPSRRITLFLQGSSGFDEHHSVTDAVSISGLTEITFAHITGLPSSTTSMTVTGNGQSQSVTINVQGTVSKN